ncbi:MAG TPA: metalloregulator ArsR/SmtB family transcription factor [Candidatus Angelobacter sp.]|jgi:DNA-binding transcriptional ArsR family regulator|nr:metalloregulator ArsR/SmtB family transcription factor [Candidatus Angelobacter sp.]
MDRLQVVTEPHRREILRMVWRREASAGDIAARFEVSFGAVSQHLALLREHGFVTVRRDGTRRFYRADRERLGDLTRVLEAMWASTLDRLVDTIEEDHGHRRR